jgi:hypothetical protein
LWRAAAAGAERQLTGARTRFARHFVATFVATLAAAGLAAVALDAQDGAS